MKPEDQGLGAQHLKRGRVGRPRRLTTSTIVTAAIDLADEQGLDALSMPQLAKRVGVGTMTLYGYVENKEDLLVRVAAEIFQGLDVPDHDNWRQGLFEFFSSFRASALAHPTLARLLATGRITIPMVFDILETSLQQMTDDGITVKEAVRIFYAGLTYTVGFVLWEIPRAHLQPEAAYADQWAGLIAQLDPGSFPILTGEATSAVQTVASPEQFEWGLNRILRG